MKGTRRLKRIILVMIALSLALTAFSVFSAFDYHYEPHLVHEYVADYYKGMQGESDNDNCANGKHIYVYTEYDSLYYKKKKINANRN